MFKLKLKFIFLICFYYFLFYRTIQTRRHTVLVGLFLKRTGNLQNSSITMACLKVGNMRVHRRIRQRGNSRYWEVNQDELRTRTLLSENFSLFWLAFQTWVRIHQECYLAYGVARLRTRATFVKSPYHNGWRGNLYYVKLDFLPDETVPRWFPRFDDAPENSRNVLHMSICFTRDIESLEGEDRLYAEQCVNELLHDPHWNGTMIHETYVSHCPRLGGTFHLAGFESDNRLKWLHENGSYKKRWFGHIALYIGGLSR